MNSSTEIKIQEKLFALQDVKYRDFQIKLIPSVDEETVIGVRTPALKSLAKEFARREDVDEFLCALPHGYFDENQLHAFIISENRDFASCMEQTERFLTNTIDPILAAYPVVDMGSIRI